MPFIETEASVRYETINGKRTPVITPKCEVTLTNTVTGKEYFSDKEAEDDRQHAGPLQRAQPRLEREDGGEAGEDGDARVEDREEHDAALELRDVVERLRRAVEGRREHEHRAHLPRPPAAPPRPRPHDPQPADEEVRPVPEQAEEEGVVPRRTRVQLRQLERLAEADAGADEGDEPEDGADLVATHNCVARLLRRTPCCVGL